MIFVDMLCKPVDWYSGILMGSNKLLKAKSFEKLGKKEFEMDGSQVLKLFKLLLFL